jgi:DNA-binding transcriptional LysR family regulator
MELTLMRSLLAVARAGAITEAAERLAITQPALSRRIQQLESLFGAPLLARGRNGVTFTEPGRLVLAEAEVLVERFDRLRESVGAHLRLEVGTVRVGGGATAVSFLVPPAIAEFQRQFGNVRFQVKEAGSREVESDVAAERLELGIVTLPVHARDLDVLPLFEDRIVLVAARDHPLARRRTVPIGALAGLGLVGFEAGSAIRHLIDASLREAGVEMNVVMELRSIPSILRMVATTQNLGFVSQLGVEADPAVRTVRARGLQVTRKLAVISKRGRTLSPAAAAFLERMLALAGERSRTLI